MKMLVLNSYAKINLGLLLFRKRADGYHDIATVFQQIGLYDEITFRKTSSSLTISSTESALPLDNTNLVHRSFDLIRKLCGIREGLKVHIRKNIPIGGGMGGGSSNAASTLLAVNRIWELHLSSDELQGMAIEIGSDVPFFLLGGTALGRGRGEILTPIHWSADYWIVTVNPGISVSTSWAYGQAKIALTKEEKFTKFRSIFKRYIPHTLCSMLINELEGVVFQRHPVLREMKERLYKKDAFYASMSGSGSTLFGLFHHHDQAVAANMFFSKMRGVTSHLCRPIELSSEDRR